MSGAKLTDEMIAGATLPAGQKLVKLTDGHSLYVVLRSDRAPQWRLRLKGSDRVLGEYPAVSIAQAREKAAALRRTPATPVAAIVPRLIAQASDAATVAPSGAVPTFGQVAADWAEHDTAISEHAKYRKRLHVGKLASLHALPVTAITLQQCVALHREIRKASGDHTAKRAGEYLSEIFRHAGKFWGVHHNPAADSGEWMSRSDRKALAERRQKHVTDPNVFGRMMDHIDLWESPQGPTSSKFLRIVARLPVRAGTLAGARWAEFNHLEDPSRAVWHVPSERQKQRNAHEYPVSRQVARLLLEQRDYIATHYPAGSPFVFPHRDTGARTIKADNQKRVLDALGYGALQSVHGFRHSAMTFAVEAGRSVDVWNRGILSHMHGDRVLARYDMSKQLEQRRVELQWWSDEVDRMVAGHTV